MSLFKYITETAPKKCKVSPQCGEIAALVYNAEMSDSVGEGAFAGAKFETCRDRAKMGLPFNPGVYQKEYEECLDIIEMAILTHRISVHKEETLQKRLNDLKTKRQYTIDELSVGTREWWNGG